MKKIVTLIVASALSLTALADGPFITGQVLTANGLNAALAAPTISGGSINNAPIGATTPASGKFTTLNATTFSATNVSAATGAGIVGYSQSNSYAAGTIGSRLKQSVFVTDPPYNAACDGTTNDSLS